MRLGEMALRARVCRCLRVCERARGRILIDWGDCAYRCAVITARTATWTCTRLLVGNSRLLTLVQLLPRRRNLPGQSGLLVPLVLPNPWWPNGIRSSNLVAVAARAMDPR